MPSASVDRHRFADWLRARLTVTQMSVGELARRIDPENPIRGQRSVRRWLSGKHAPSDEMLKRVARALGVSAAVVRRAAEPEEEKAA